LYKYFLSTFFLFHLKTSITPNLEILKQQFFLKILKLKLKKKKDIIKLNIIGKIKKTSKIQSFSFLKKQNISIKNILNKIDKLNLNLKKKNKKKINEIRHYKRQI
jgi:GTP-binding protein EngB required for normal cell division